MISAVIRAAKRKSGHLLDWMVYRGDDWDTYWLKQHINGCRDGYIWRGGLVLGGYFACWHCNRKVYHLSLMLKDKKESLQNRAIIKDMLEEAKQERANRKLPH